jgi:hypothetical protein
VLPACRVNLESARICVVATALLVVLPLRSAHAQVNTENLRKRIKTVGYSVIVEGTLTGDVGNTQGISVGGGLGGGWARDPHLLFAYARFDYTKYAGVTSVDKSFAHARYNYEFAPWIWGEVFAQAESDEFQRLTLRNLFGVGPRARLAHVVADEGPSEEAKLPAAANPSPEAQRAATHAPTETFDVYVGTAYMLERDAIVPVVGATGPENRSIQVWQRWSNYLTLQWQIDPRAILATTMYVQPAFTDFTDVRLLSETLMTFKITKVFATGVSGVVRYDSNPPTGVLTTDAEVKNTLTVTF